MEKLKNIDTKERPVYDLFRDINLIISECQDGHFTIDYNKEILNGYKLSEMFFISPIEYQITKNGVYGKPSYLSGLFDQDLINQIKQNEDKKIVLINLVGPLNYRKTRCYPRNLAIRYLKYIAIRRKHFNYKINT